jgi:hypothetical protein
MQLQAELFGGGIVPTRTKPGIRICGYSATRCGRFTTGTTWYPLYRREGGHWGQCGWHGKSSPNCNSKIRYPATVKENKKCNQDKISIRIYSANTW